MIVGKFTCVDLSPVFDRLGQLGIGDNAEEYFFCLIGAYTAAKQIEKILVIRPQKLDLAVLVSYPDNLIAVKRGAAKGEGRLVQARLILQAECPSH